MRRVLRLTTSLPTTRLIAARFVRSWQGSAYGWLTRLTAGVLELAQGDLADARGDDTPIRMRSDLTVYRALADVLPFMASSLVSWLYCLMEIRPRILDCPANDEHIVRRLGKAVVVQWDALPGPVQDLILKQAVLMHDRHRVLQLRHKVRAFIQNWKIVE